MVCVLVVNVVFVVYVNYAKYVKYADYMILLHMLLCFGVEDFAVGAFLHLPTVDGVGGAEGAVILVVGEDVLALGTCRWQVVVHSLEWVEVDEAAELELACDLVVETLAALG